MDDRGRIYDQVDQEKKTARNMETGKTISTKGVNLTELPPDKVEMLKSMNRADRRAWLTRYKKELAKIRGKS